MPLESSRHNISGKQVKIFADYIQVDAKFVTSREKSEYTEMAKACLFITWTKRLHVTELRPNSCAGGCDCSLNKTQQHT